MIAIVRLRRACAAVAVVCSILVPSARADTAAGLQDFQAGRFSEAFAEWRQGADQGNVTSALYLGVLYDAGFGVPQDGRKALAWYEVAAAGGNRTAMLNAALMYDSGRGTKPDEQAAIAWYERAAGAGEGRAEYNLALIYEGGDRVPADRSRAIALYRAAAGHGITAASTHLASLGVGPASGIGRRRAAGASRPPALDPAMADFDRAQNVLLSRDPGKARDAAQLFLKAAEAGSPLAAYNLAYCYEHGLGVAIDPEQALIWYRRSVAAAGNGPVREIASAGVRNLLASVNHAQR